MSTVYFHRKTGVAFACDSNYVPRLKERLQEVLGDKFVDHEWETAHAFGSAIRLKAVDEGWLDITTVHDPNII